MFFDKLSDVMVVLVKSIESYIILDKHYLTIVLPKIRLRGRGGGGGGGGVLHQDFLEIDFLVVSDREE